MPCMHALVSPPTVMLFTPYSWVGTFMALAESVGEQTLSDSRYPNRARISQLVFNDKTALSL